MTARKRKSPHMPSSTKAQPQSGDSRYQVLTRWGNDQRYWQKCVRLNQVYVVVEKRGKTADVLYDTDSKKPREADRLSKRGIEIVSDLFESHGCKEFVCDATSGRTKKSMPFEAACRLAEVLCEVFDTGVWQWTDRSRTEVET